jgi:transketolase
LNYRKRILEISQTVTAAHVAPAFSCIDIVDVIYNRLLRLNDLGTEFVDTFVMSKGHGCLAQYVVLEELGFLNLSGYCKGGLGAHPDRGTVEASTGSLGHGLGMCVGMAYADRERLVYCLLSDGELQEGSTWEALMVGANLDLKNLVVFLDLNDFQSLGRTSVNHPSFYPVDDKVKAFGWDCVEVDGHDKEAVHQAVLNRKGRLFVICKTVKGKGVSYMENVPLWHYRSPNEKEYQSALRELDA